MATAIYSNKEYSQEYYDCSVNINGTLLFDENERKELFLLVSNHSGISFEAAALKTQELTEYFDENTDLEYKLLVLPGQDFFRTHPRLAKATDSFPGLPDYGRIERVLL